MPGKHWFSREKKRLANLSRQGYALVDIRVSGRSQSATRSQAMRLGLLQPQSARTAWSRQQQRILKALWRQGCKPEDVFFSQLLGAPHRSLWAIKKKWGRMKLADRRRARQISQKKVWQTRELQKFHDFLRGHSHHMTPEEMGSIWECAFTTVIHHQIMLGVRRSRQVVMTMPYSVAKQIRGRRRGQKKIKKIFAARRVVAEQKLVAHAQILQQHSPDIEMRICKDCQRSWPKRVDFFHYQDRRITIGNRRRWHTRCRLCTRAQRRERESKRLQKASRRKLKVFAA